MDNPIFKLESVVHERSAEALQDFEGPLDLILFLLSKNKIEIQDIPIALILEQYLAYLEERRQLDLDIASDFITMAAHLMYIKTRMLLSIEDEEAQSEMDELIASLKERQQKDTYMRIRTLTETLGPMGEFGRSIMTRNPEPMQHGKVYEYDHEKADLILAMQSVLDRGERMAPPPSAAFSEIVKREPYPVADKAGEIVKRLKHFGMTRFLLLFKGARSRSEIVATFIAVLELCRARVIRLVGSDTDCTVDCEKDAPETIAM
ncbi:MAG: segregation/condensation protein A [Oscillospiraceae bacterium]|nr:segregation/condensation protein A [Oscillospiraceae bacterium]MDD5808202.1 segregation/condensation protein A [Oscillospiraceae bacterium]MDD5964542.1 segregation/condensation protein A [Oscillospiraceae bacterium]MDY6020375.1 segregation/condensation protein A [Oscillospiraceae bacterium]